MESSELSKRPKLKRRPVIVFLVLFVLAAGGALAATAIPTAAEGEGETGNVPAQPGVTSTAPAGDAARNGPEPINVETTKVEVGNLTEYVKATGVTAAIKDVRFAAEIPGRVEFLGVDLGDKVRKGQILARVDFRTLKAQATQAEARFELAETTHRRLNELGDKLVSRQQLDEAASALTGARAQLAIARDNLSKSVIRSTLRGVVSAKHVEKAEYVGPGTPIVRVVDYSTVLIEAQLPETQIAMIEPGEAVRVEIGALGERFEGTVDSVLPAADPVSKTFTARITVENPERRILVGMSASVSIAARRFEDAVVVPQDVVVEGKGRRTVFVVDGGMARERQVRLGAIEGERVVVLEGLSPGELLVTVGQRELTDGQAIQIVR
jgi:membrane fusion protein (multidrug efflux system)